MKRWRIIGFLALAIVAVALVAACGGEEEVAVPPPPTDASEPAPPAEPPAEEPPPAEPPAEEPPANGEGPQPGGTYRLDWEASFNFTNNLDPTGEYLSEAWAILRNLLLRPLMGYKHVAGAEGNELIPDLATDFPEISDDGLTYTFTIRDGVKFGPPLSREITSQDVAYAFERIANANLGAQYFNYYVGTIAGMEEVFDGEADTISGIQTPDDKTIVFTLTQPTGDFLFRLAMPATAPIPEEVAGCFSQPGDYGRYLVSSGPYMLEGSDQVDATSCDTLEPFSGYDPDQFLLVVRNPGYDPSTDNPEARENFPDRFEWRINSSNADIYDRVAAGEIEDEIGSESPKVLREYSTTDELRDNLHIHSGDLTWYITLNLSQPPFDDIHVRKAVNLVMNKQGLRLAWGGEIAGQIATHIAPDFLLDNLLESYDPYSSENFEGDEEAAKAEMAQSKYDSDGDGVCDDPVCKDVLHVTGDSDTRIQMIPVMEESLGKIGITLESRANANVYKVLQTPSRNLPISGQSGWSKDYPDASTFFTQLFDGRTILPGFNATNWALVGLDPATAAEAGITGSVEGIPSVDADIDACQALPVGADRVQCWADLDKKLMEEVVPWVPYLWSEIIHVTSDKVTKWEFDQASTSIAYAHVAVAQ